MNKQSYNTAILGFISEQVRSWILSNGHYICSSMFQPRDAKATLFITTETCSIGKTSLQKHHQMNYNVGIQHFESPSFKVSLNIQWSCLLNVCQKPAKKAKSYRQQCLCIPPSCALFALLTLGTNAEQWLLPRNTCAGSHAVPEPRKPCCWPGGVYLGWFTTPKWQQGILKTIFSCI